LIEKKIVFELYNSLIGESRQLTNQSFGWDGLKRVIIDIH